MSGVLRQRLSGLAIIVSVAVIASFAVLYRGYPSPDVQLNDGGVWVTNRTEQKLAHLNYPSRLLDVGVTGRTADYDLFQDGNNVLAFDQNTGTLSALRVATVRFDQGEATLTPQSRVSARGGSLGVIDAANDGLYVLSTKDVTGFTATGRDPLATLGKGSVVTVGTDGAVYAASLQGSLVTVPDPKSGPTTQQLGAFKPGAQLQLAAVGTTPVVLDAANGALYVNGRTIELPEAKDGKLQASGPANDSVLVTGPSGLIVQPLDGSKASIDPVQKGGTPSQPVWVAGCGYAVWSGTGTYVRHCASAADNRNEAIPGAAAAQQLTLRQNRDVVVINELVNGMVWLPDDGLFQVSNWQDIKEPEQDGEKQSKRSELSFELPKRTEKNHPPVAVPDSYSVRAGTTAILPVLENDTDQDGDLLEASLVGKAPDGMTVQTVSSGAALQVHVDENFAGTAASLEYQADDGRENGKAKARINLEIVSSGANTPPKQDHPQTVMVELGATVNLDALVGWSDPERDDLVLEGADSNKGDKIVYRSNGVLQFTEGGELGVHEVTIKVSDGKESTTGKVLIDVRAKDSLPPIANADRYNTTVGQSITIAPVANDLSPSGQELDLVKVDDAGPGVTTSRDTANNTFSFKADKAQTYYVQYLVQGGTKAADGIVRIDVHGASGDDLAPLATRDVALLTPAQQTLVDVLANDTDPSGGILVVQSVTVPSGAKVSAEVLEHRVLRVTDAGLDEPTTIEYQVCGGARCSTGEVRVVPVARTRNSAAPVAMPDKATVRAGDIVTVDVMANDYHPAGDAFELLPDLKEVPSADKGDAFVSEGKVRFRANDLKQDEQVQIVYEIRDVRGHVTAGFLRVEVVPADEATNAEPNPVSLTGRTVAGTSVRIPVPMDGIDPDGDSVELVGIDSAPSKGRVSVGDSWLTYDAYQDSVGPDTFTYVVRDRLGAKATGTAVVGIARPSNQNQAPYTVMDEVTVRPGRNVSVPVLTNDSDPDGDQVALLADGLKAPAGVVASVAKSRVAISGVSSPGVYTISYTAVDPFGARAVGTLVLTVDEKAPLLPPLARDDHVQPAQLTGSTVDVPVVDNDEDPDGDAAQLTVTTGSPNAAPGAPGVLKVTLAPKPQLILYTVTDIDGLSASAVIFVPGTDALLPTLKDMAPLEVIAGKELRISLPDVVVVRTGHTASVAEADSARTSHGAGDKLVTDRTTLTYTSEPDYYGWDAIGVRVTDGEGPDDPKGNSAYLSIPIRVLPAENEPPTLKESTIAVVPGEATAEVNLTKLTSDPNPADAGQFRYNLQSVPAGFTANLVDGQLQVGAGGSTKVGTIAQIPVEVSDLHGGTSVGRVNVLVTRSQRGAPVAVDDAVPQAAQGQAVSVDVLHNDVNPFKDDGMPLTLLSARPVIDGRGTVAVNGDKLDITPDAHFVGTMEVIYRMQDAVERTAEATVRVTVQGAPDQVARPQVVTVGNQSVVLAWTTPEHNGSPITGYTVTSTVGGFSQKCATTTCTLRGLENNKEYTFRVVATNAIGDSEPSVPSPVARPDVRPDTPAAPTLVFGDKQLTVSWKTPHSDGSPVVSYNLQISPAPATGALQRNGVTGNQLVWTGLANGTSYKVKVQATNRAPDPSAWSAASRPETPAGKPDAPGQPTTSPAAPVGGQAQIEVSWPAVSGSASNGDAVKKYTLRIAHGGSTREVTTSDTKQNITVDPSTTSYSFAVSATNKAGSSPFGPTSTRRAALPPGVPTNVHVEYKKSQEVTLTFTPGDLNGNSASEIKYRARVQGTNDWWGTGNGWDIVGLENGKKYTFEVWAVSSVEGVLPGKAGVSNSIVTYGPPLIPSMSIKGGKNQVTFHWTVDDNGAPITARDAPVGGLGDLSWTKTGLADGESYELCLSYTNKAGTERQCADGKADPREPSRYWLDRSGDAVYYHYSNFRSSDFAQVTTMRCWRYTRDGHPGGFATDGAGQTSFSRPAEGSSGSIQINCGSGVSNSYSVEPWKYGPWLNMNESETR